MARARASARSRSPHLSGYGGQFGERLRLGAVVGDGAGQGLGMIEASKPGPHGGQVGRNGLVADGDCVPVDGQLHQSLQVRHVLSCDELVERS